MTGFVYAIGDGCGRVKIGWSGNPIRRLAKLGSDCATPVCLLGIIPATRAQEAELHSLLSPWRANREWFRLSGPVLSFVERLPKFRPHPVPPTSSHPLDIWLAEHGKSRLWLAAEISTTRATLSRIISGNQWPSRELAQKIAAATKGAVTADHFLDIGADGHRASAPRRKPLRAGSRLSGARA